MGYIDLTADDDAGLRPGLPDPVHDSASSCDELDLLLLDQRFGSAAMQSVGTGSAVTALRAHAHAGQQDSERWNSLACTEVNGHQPVASSGRGNEGSGSPFPGWQVSDTISGRSTAAASIGHISANFTGFSREAARESGQSRHTALNSKLASQVHGCDLFARAEAARCANRRLAGLHSSGVTFDVSTSHPLLQVPLPVMLRTLPAGSLDLASVEQGSQRGQPGQPH